MNLKHGDQVSVILPNKTVLRDRIVYANYLDKGYARTSRGHDLQPDQENLTWCRGWTGSEALMVTEALK